MPSPSAPSPSLQPILEPEALRRIERGATDAGLMERAGAAAAGDARELMGARAGNVLVLAGPGNNGGDAFVVARHLRASFCDVTVVFGGDADRLPADAAAAHAAFVAAGGSAVRELPALAPFTLIIDGLFGIGLRRAVAEPYATWIARANEAPVPVLALDVPSGLDAHTGLPVGPAVRANATSTFIALKPGLVTGEGGEHCGELHVHDLGLADAIEREGCGYLVTWESLAAALPEVLQRRRKNVHKGTFGTLSILGGAVGMLGAPLLAARAALRVGAGRVRVGYAAQTYPAVDFVAPELMLRDARGVVEAGGDVFVVGPGLGADPPSRELVNDVLGLDVPVVVDADALNLVARDPALRERLRVRGKPTLLTPHPAEAARLLGVDTRTVQADRLAACRSLARDLNAHVVLKGAGSVLVSPDGRWGINASGNPGLSAAGSGDVLAGIAGAMLAQHLEPHDALRYAVCLHGAAADALVADGDGPLGLVAGELAGTARALLNDAARKLRTSGIRHG